MRAYLPKFRLIILLSIFASTTGFAQVFNFYGTEYFLSPDNSFNQGTQLSASGTNLSGFNFSTADPTHPLFATGIYFPIQDCGNRNLWVRLQHIAHDPNGKENGFSIDKTLNSPFLPIGSTDRIGGWAGFLYDIRIFADQNIEGSRANILGSPFNTNITVESLETLYNDGGIMFEWLSFEIINEESTGWVLNSTNFTGINPLSNPGFSSELRYSTTNTPGSPPEGFSTDFPSLSKNIYAIDLNLSNAYHSEFRMSASGVSHFRYGYEFSTGGYQGMSMAFGQGPEIDAEVTEPLCAGAETGAISLVVTGYEPISYSWSHGDSSAIADSLSAGNYSVAITDAAGCVVNKNYIVEEPDSLIASINLEEGEETPSLVALCSGGTGNYSYNWNTGETESRITPESIGPYSVAITDENGCTANVQFEYLSIENSPDQANVIKIYPNPAVNKQIFIENNLQAATLRLFNASGQLVHTCQLSPLGYQICKLPDFPSGLYFYQIDAYRSGKLLIE
jgi:hypothetical protein